MTRKHRPTHRLVAERHEGSLDWACYLINGDASTFDGLYDSPRNAARAQRAADAFQASIDCGCPVDIDNKDEMRGTCEYVFLREVETKYGRKMRRKEMAREGLKLARLRAMYVAPGSARAISDARRLLIMQLVHANLQRRTRYNGRYVFPHHGAYMEVTALAIVDAREEYEAQLYAGRRF